VCKTFFFSNAGYPVTDNHLFRLETNISPESIHGKKVFRLSPIHSFKEALEVASENPSNLYIKDEKTYDILQEILIKFDLQDRKIEQQDTKIEQLNRKIEQQNRKIEQQEKNIKILASETFLW
jgi:predicted ribosome quality control (RQC) complex YloA/Tae2 family protein